MSKQNFYNVSSAPSRLKSFIYSLLAIAALMGLLWIGRAAYLSATDTPERDGYADGVESDDTVYITP